MKNHNQMLTRWKWMLANNEFRDMTSFKTDCILYEFYRPLTSKEQEELISFLGDSDHANSLSPLDFCNYFYAKCIPFGVRYELISKLGLRRNFGYFRIVMCLKKILRDADAGRVEEYREEGGE